VLRAGFFSCTETVMGKRHGPRDNGNTGEVSSTSGWMPLGACQREDPELFFPISAKGPALDQISAAKAVCRRCAVRPACLSFGLETRQEGIWGGTTSEERSAMRDRPAGMAAQIAQLARQ